MADWIAAGLPTVGGPHPGRALDAMDRQPVTATPDERVGDVVARIAAAGRTAGAVVDGAIVIGRIGVEHPHGDAGARVETVMEPGPTTVRADVDADETRARLQRHGVTSVFVTTPNGALLGELLAEGGVSPDRGSG